MPTFHIIDDKKLTSDVKLLTEYDNINMLVKFKGDCWWFPVSLYFFQCFSVLA